MKKQIAEDIVHFVNPIQERIKEISADEKFLKKTIDMGGEKARISAAKTLKDVREIIGFLNA
jgi:tryptophanyl-tRNA synthetase